MAGKVRIPPEAPGSASSLLVMGALMGSDVRLGEPHPPKDVTDLAKDIAGRTGARITVTEDRIRSTPAS